MASALTSGPAVEAAQATPTAAPLKPLVGALYYTGFKSRYKSWQDLGECPALGWYDSGSVGTIDAHRHMATQAGIQFFATPFSSEETAVEQRRNIGKMLGRTDGKAFKVAVLLQPAQESCTLARARRQRLLEHGDYVSEMAGRLIQGYDTARREGWLDHASYLRAEDGRQVFGFLRWDDAGATCDVLAEVFSRRPDIAAESWIWYAGGREIRANASRVARTLAPDRGAWLAIDPADGAAWASSLEMSQMLGLQARQRVIAVCPSFAAGEGEAIASRDAGERLARQLEEMARLPIPPTHVLINSFNDWRNASAVEPGTASGHCYLDVIERWTRTRA